MPVATAKAIGNSVGVVMFMPILFWERKGEKWFVPFLIAIAIAHALVILLMPWGLAPIPAAGQKDIFILFAFLDVAVCALLAFAVIKFSALLGRRSR